MKGRKRVATDGKGALLGGSRALQSAGIRSTPGSAGIRSKGVVRDTDGSRKNPEVQGAIEKESCEALPGVGKTHLQLQNSEPTTFHRLLVEHSTPRDQASNENNKCQGKTTGV